MFLGNCAYAVSHQTYNYKSKRCPQHPAAHQIEQCHSNRTSQCASTFSKNNCCQKQRYISQMNQSAISCNRKPDIDKSCRNKGKCNADSGDCDLRYRNCLFFIRKFFRAHNMLPPRRSLSTILLLIWMYEYIQFFTI